MCAKLEKRAASPSHSRNLKRQIVQRGLARRCLARCRKAVAPKCTGVALRCGPFSNARPIFKCAARSARGAAASRQQARLRLATQGTQRQAKQHAHVMFPIPFSRAARKKIRGQYKYNMGVAGQIRYCSHQSGPSCARRQVGHGHQSWLKSC